MSFFDDAFDLGKDIVDVAGEVSGLFDSGGSKSSLPPLNLGGFMTPLEGAKGFSPSQRRIAEPTQKAESFKDKLVETPQEEQGDDAIDLANMWNKLMEEVMFDETG